MYWNWKTGGIALGLIFFLAVLLVKPIGVSTQFVILDGITAKLFNSELVVQDEAAKTGYASSNPYLNKSGGKYARSVANPLNYGFLFVLSTILGGLLGRYFTRSKNAEPVVRQVPQVHSRKFGATPFLRYFLAFAGGFLVLWGARLAGGCTSGHMMSGMMQTSLSAYFFTAAVFATAIPVAIVFYKK